MESRLGDDFSGVRLHTDPDANRAADRERAQAFTVGDDIVFGSGRYVPGTPGGDALLAHELGHVRDQREAGTMELQRQPQGEEVAPPAAVPQRYELDPGIDTLSLGLSTLDGFDFNQATLKPAHRPRIADVAGKLIMLLEKLPTGRVTVIGHADLVGGEDVNLAIGQRRAEAVEAALVAAGVPAARIDTGSEGRRAPVAKKAGRHAANRRVEVRFQGRLILPGAMDRPSLGGETLTPPGGQPGIGSPFPPTLPEGFPRPTRPTIPVGPKPASKPEPKGTEGPARAASGGDLAKALMAVPEVKTNVDAIKEKAGREAGKVWKGASPGEKVALGSFTLSAASLVAAGILSDPGATSLARDILDGKEIALPVRGVKLKLHTKDQLGGSIVIDVLEFGR
jgi:outer membrane protein OmpA-like peptidoglycan-associated protein